MTGEIIDQRYAVLERTGPDRYLVFDMRGLCQVQLQLLLGGAQYLVVEPFAPAAPPRPAAVPPPLPAERPASPPPLPAAVASPAARGDEPPSRAAVLEAAWFAHGERFEAADEEGVDIVADAEAPDYPRYQQLLEQLAEELSAALFAKYALDSAD